MEGGGIILHINVNPAHQPTERIEHFSNQGLPCLSPGDDVAKALPLGLIRLTDNPSVQLLELPERTISGVTSTSQLLPKGTLI